MPLFVLRSSLPPRPQTQQKEYRRRTRKQRLQDHPPDTSSVENLGFQISLQLRGLDLLRLALDYSVPAVGDRAGRKFDGQFVAVADGPRDDLGSQSLLRFPSRRRLQQPFNLGRRIGLAPALGTVEIGNQVVVLERRRHQPEPCRHRQNRKPGEHHDGDYQPRKAFGKLHRAAHALLPFLPSGLVKTDEFWSSLWAFVRSAEH